FINSWRTSDTIYIWMTLTVYILFILTVLVTESRISRIKHLLQRFSAKYANIPGLSRKQTLTLVGLLTRQKHTQVIWSSVVLIAALGIYFSTSYLIKVEAVGVPITLVCLLSAITINQEIFRYRIRKGLYGTNRYEAQEI